MVPATLAPLLALALAATVLAAKSVPVTLSPLVPSGANTLSGSLFSFSIEQDNWPLWAGTDSRNTYFYTLLTNLKDITGEAPWLRIGADSEDHTNWNPAVEYNSDIFPAYTAITPYPEATNITVGQGFYDVIKYVPSGTNVWWGVNLGQANVTAAYYEALAIVKAFESSEVKKAGVTLKYIEIGNEADLYTNNGARKGTWNISTYVNQWTEFATNVSDALQLSTKANPKLVGCAFANSDYLTSGFSPEGAFTHGLLNSSAGKQIGIISQHHYSGSACTGSGGLLQQLMLHKNVASNLSAFSPDIAATQAVGLPYVFGETNSYACHGSPNVSNTAGAALWMLDYVLYAPTIGIERVHFHEGIGYKYNLIQPVALNRSILDGTPLATPVAPHIQPAYYSAIITAEAIGNSGLTQAVEIPINNTYLAGYAFYEGQVLARAVFINSQAWLTTSNGTRTNETLQLGFGSAVPPSSLTIKRLAIGHADDASGVTWGGQSYETSDGRVSGQESTETVDVSEGVSITQTEAVLVTFNYL